MGTLKKGENDLLTVNKTLAQEWDDILNDGLKPSDVAVGSSKKVWWVCKNGHKWQATPKNRSRGTGCPFCSGRLPVKGENDLVTMFPLIAEEWNYKKNVGLMPEDFTYGSSKKVWWICKKGHEWQSSLSHRVGGRGCPKCKSEKSTSFPEQAILFYLKQLFPDVINRYKPSWLKTKNSSMEIDIYIPSKKIGVEYDGWFFHVSKERDEKKDLAVVEHGIELYRIREPKLPDLSTGSICINIASLNGRFYYQNAIIELIKLLSKKSEQNKKVVVDVKKDYSSILELYKIGERSNSIAVMCPELLSEWECTKNDGLDPYTISSGSNHLIWWECKQCGHVWQATPKHRANGEGCPLCGRKNGAYLRVKNKISNGKSMTLEQWCINNGIKGKELLKEWSEENVYKPSEFTYSSRRKVFWICAKGHTYSACIGNRTGNGTTCPYCSGKATLEGYNDLATTNPELLSEWDSEKNTILPTSVRKGSNKKVWWKCEKGHSYQAIIYNKALQHTKCPYCSNARVLSGFNDLATINPELLEEWDYNKNTIPPSEIMSGSEKKFFWKCKNCGNEWLTSVAYRTSGAGCPRCAKSKAGKIARQRNKEKKNFS